MFIIRAIYNFRSFNITSQNSTIIWQKEYPFGNIVTLKELKGGEFYMLIVCLQHASNMITLEKAIRILTGIRASIMVNLTVW